jgi:hypothetical protein
MIHISKEASYALFLQYGIIDQASVGKSCSGQSTLPLDAPRIRRASTAQVGILKVIIASIGLTETVCGTQVRGRRMWDSVVQRADHFIVHLLRKIARRVQTGKDA